MNRDSATRRRTAGECRTTFSAETSAIRALAMDAVQQAGSGHPGMPMGMAEIADVVWRRHLRHDPADPHWPGRDRFVVSNGHGSMLLYALLHLTGHDLPIEELQRFRQLGSRTPGHPEHGLTPGVETTTGPLGEGLANAVGMALAERLLALEFNLPGHRVVDHRTFVFVGDGCLMEGISHEACSLAGTLARTVGLGKLVVFWDDNGISIDGKVEGWFTEDVAARFEAYGWQVIREVDGHDVEAVDAATRDALADEQRPTLVCCRTEIGHGSPGKAGGHDVHGAPLGADEVAAARATIGWSHPPFEVPEAVRSVWDARSAGRERHGQWAAVMERYAEEHPELAAELRRRLEGRLPGDWNAQVAAALVQADAAGESVATRKASQQALEALAPALPELFGGSADLTGSNLTSWSGSVALDHTGGNYLSYGVREFAMAAIMNGVALHGGLIPYGGTFLMFSDYARNAIRMASLMHLRSVFVLTHDSVGLGEDGPTHQPVEQTATLRLVPGLHVWRPCDTVETTLAWAAAIGRQDGPTALVLSRQGTPYQSRSSHQLAMVARGGYVLRDGGDRPDVVLVATGSEVSLVVHAAAELLRDGVRARVVSMPCTEVFDGQEESYRHGVLPADVPRLAVEAGVTDGWWRYVGDGGAVIGIDTFGESGPAGDLWQHFGLTVERVVEAARALLPA